MRNKLFGLTLAAMTALAGVSHAQEEKKVTIGVSIPAADHGWTAGVVFHAERVAKHFGTRHHAKRFTANDLLATIPQVAAMLDEPFADPSVLPVAMLSGFARERVTVALGGDGGTATALAVAPRCARPREHDLVPPPGPRDQRGLRRHARRPRHPHDDLVLSAHWSSNLVLPVPRSHIDDEAPAERRFTCYSNVGFVSPS